MKKLLFNLTAFLVLSLSAAPFLPAQTEQELNAEADRFAREIVEKNLAPVEMIIKDLGREIFLPTNMVSIVEPLHPKILFSFGMGIASTPNPYTVQDDAAIFLRSIETMPDEPSAYSNFALFLSNQGYSAEAEKYYNKAVEIATAQKLENVNQHTALGRAAFFNGNYPVCVQSFNKSLTFEKHPFERRWDYAYLSWCYGLQGDTANADAALQKAFKASSSLQHEFFVKSGAYLQKSADKCKDERQMSKNYFGKSFKNLEEQYKVFFRLVSCHPNSLPILEEGSRLMSKLDHPTFSNTYRVRAEKIRNPSAPPIDQIPGAPNARGEEIANLLKNAYNNWDFNAAFNLANLMLIHNYKPNLAREYRARLFLLTAGYKLLAWREASKIIAANPDHSGARIVRARVYLEVKNNPEMALAEISRAFKGDQDDNSFDTYLTRGRIFLFKKDYARAMQDFNAAEQKNPDNHILKIYKALAQNPQDANALEKQAAIEKRGLLVLAYGLVENAKNRSIYILLGSVDISSEPNQ